MTRPEKFELVLRVFCALLYSVNAIACAMTHSSWWAATINAVAAIIWWGLVIVHVGLVREHIEDRVHREMLRRP